MESKRMGFVKSKLIKSFCRSGKPKLKASPPPSSAGVGFIIVNQDQVFPTQMPKVAFVVPERNNESYATLEGFYGGWAEDEAVDAKAARYISSVQERFRLERVNSERKNFEGGMQL